MFSIAGNLAQQSTARMYSSVKDTMFKVVKRNPQKQINYPKKVSIISAQIQRIDNIIKKSTETLTLNAIADLSNQQREPKPNVNKVFQITVRDINTNNDNQVIMSENEWIESNTKHNIAVDLNKKQIKKPTPPALQTQFNKDANSQFRIFNNKVRQKLYDYLYDCVTTDPKFDNIKQTLVKDRNAIESAFDVEIDPLSINDIMLKINTKNQNMIMNMYSNILKKCHKQLPKKDKNPITELELQSGWYESLKSSIQDLVVPFDDYQPKIMDVLKLNITTHNNDFAISNNVIKCEFDTTNPNAEKVQIKNKKCSYIINKQSGAICNGIIDKDKKITNFVFQSKPATKHNYKHMKNAQTEINTVIPALSPQERKSLQQQPNVDNKVFLQSTLLGEDNQSAQSTDTDWIPKICTAPYQRNEDDGIYSIQLVDFKNANKNNEHLTTTNNIRNALPFSKYNDLVWETNGYGEVFAQKVNISNVVQNITQEFVSEACPTINNDYYKMSVCQPNDLKVSHNNNTKKYEKHYFFIISSF